MTTKISLKPGDVQTQIESLIKAAEDTLVGDLEDKIEEQKAKEDAQVKKVTLSNEIDWDKVERDHDIQIDYEKLATQVNRGVEQLSKLLMLEENHLVNGQSLYRSVVQ